MVHKYVALTYFVITIAAGIFMVFQIGTSMNPAGLIADNVQNLFDVSVYSNIASPFVPVSLSITPIAAPTILCSSTIVVNGITDSGSTVKLSQQTTSGIQAFRNFNVNDLTYSSQNSGASTSTTGARFVNFQIQSRLQCPPMSASFPANLQGGTTSLWWVAAKKDGTMVTVIRDTQPINVSPLPKPLSSADVILYTWTISKSQIESAIGVNPTGDFFTSLSSLQVTDKLGFYQGSATAAGVWNADTTNSPASVFFKLQENTNPIGVISNDAMDLKILNPTNGQIDLKANSQLTAQALVTNWQIGQGQPEIKLYYTDPSNTNQNGLPTFDFLLNPDTPSQSGQANVASFTFRYVFPANAQSGQYTMELHMNGRIAVVKQNIMVGSKTVTCPSVNGITQFFDSSLAQPACRPTIQTTVCPDGTLVPSGTQCAATNIPKPPQANGTQNGPTGVCTDAQTKAGWVPTTVPLINPPTQICAPAGSTNSIDYTQLGNAISQNYIIIAVFAFLLIIGAVIHSLDKRQGGKGLAPEVIVE